jgi:uncharacterized NAD-dependent epimerase/dehydratase family protein
MITPPNYNTRAVRRLAILQHGGILGESGKTGLSLLRYCRDRIAVVIDRETAGRSLGELTGLPGVGEIPIVASVAEALKYSPEALAIGIAPSGGSLPAIWQEDMRLAVRSGVSIWNGLHTSIAADPEIARFLRPSVHVWDMRREPPGLTVGTGAARELECARVLFVGTDMAIGKMTAALELDRAARARGLRSKFIATGQGGMMIAGDGICLDAIRVDYASGAVQGEVLQHGRSQDILWVEGQGSLLNPASTATLPLLRGTQPTHLILVHKAGRSCLRSFKHIAIPPLDKVVAFYEAMATAAGAFVPVKVVAVALNTWGMDDVSAAKVCEH